MLFTLLMVCTTSHLLVLFVKNRSKFIFILSPLLFLIFYPVYLILFPCKFVLLSDSLTHCRNIKILLFTV